MRVQRVRPNKYLLKYLTEEKSIEQLVEVEKNKTLMVMINLIICKIEG